MARRWRSAGQGWRWISASPGLARKYATPRRGALRNTRHAVHSYLGLSLLSPCMSRTHLPLSPPYPALAHWPDIKVSALRSRVGWTPARNIDRTNERPGDGYMAFLKFWDRCVFVELLSMAFETFKTDWPWLVDSGWWRCAFCADFAVECIDYDAHRVSVGRRSTEDHDDLHDRSAQPRRGQQAHLAASRERAGVHLAVAGASSLGRQRTGLFRQHLWRTFPLFARVPWQLNSPCHYSINGQVCSSITCLYTHLVSLLRPVFPFAGLNWLLQELVNNFDLMRVRNHRWLIYDISYALDRPRFNSRYYYMSLI